MLSAAFSQSCQGILSLISELLSHSKIGGKELHLYIGSESDTISVFTPTIPPSFGVECCSWPDPQGLQLLFVPHVKYFF